MKEKQITIRINTAFRVLVIPSLLLFMSGIYRIDKYINWHLYVLYLLAIGGIIGLIISSVIYKKLKRSLNNKETKNLEDQNFFFKACILIILICFGAGALLGESNATTEETKQFKIVNKGTSGSRKGRQFYIFINQEGKTSRYAFGKSTYDLYDVGDSIKLSIKSNLFGFEYIEPEHRNQSQHLTTPIR